MKDRSKPYGTEHSPFIENLRKQAILRRVKMRRDAINTKDFEAVRECESALRFLIIPKERRSQWPTS